MFKPQLQDNSDESYFEEDVKRTSSSRSQQPTVAADDDDDPLDAYMASIAADCKKQTEVASTQQPKQKAEVIEAEDNAAELYYKYKKENKTFALSLNTDDSAESVYATAATADKMNAEGGVHFDEKGELVTKKSTQPEPLKPVDHSKMKYKPFTKNIYELSQEVKDLTEVNNRELNRRMHINVAGYMPAKTVANWDYFGGWEAGLRQEIKKLEFEAPSAIQAAAIPNALSGRDILGIAKTGSGKTLAYLIPLMLHVAAQDQPAKGEGPIAVIATPTRELAKQVFEETKKFCKLYKLKSLPIFGGRDKGDQIRALKNGCDIVVCSPGRMIEMLGKSKACTFKQVTFLVVDEADKMFEMGYDHQIVTLIQQIRPDRQTLFFTATMPAKVEELARLMLKEPIRIVVGQESQANERIAQTIKICGNKHKKWQCLMELLPMAKLRGLCLVFCNTRVNCEDISTKMCEAGFVAASLHGNKSQEEREDALQAFRSATVGFLVATDVASRGLDLSDVNTVINYDLPDNLDSYIHRIGRTARGVDASGCAYTLMVQNESNAVEMAGHLVRTLEAVGQDVADDLLALAKQSGDFCKTRDVVLQAILGIPKPGARRGKGGAGLGFEDKTGGKLKKPLAGTGMGGMMSMLGFVKSSDPKPKPKPKPQPSSTTPPQQPDSATPPSPAEVNSPATDTPKKKFFVVLPKKAPTAKPADVHYDTILRDTPVMGAAGVGGGAMSGAVLPPTVIQTLIPGVHAGAQKAQKSRKRYSSSSCSSNSSSWRRRRKDRKRRKKSHSSSSSSGRRRDRRKHRSSSRDRKDRKHRRRHSSGSSHDGKKRRR